MKNHYLVLLTFVLLSFGEIFAQYHVNVEWTDESGNPIFLDKSHSITNASNELIHVGNSMITGQGANILLSKYNTSGTLLWQSVYNSSGVNNDYGVKVIEDASGNIYVIGTTDNNNTSTDFDIVVLKYSSGGSLLWADIYGSPFSFIDVPIGLKLDTSGNLYVCASSEGSGTLTDFLLLKYTASGTLSWTNRYDYNSLIEIPVDIDFDGYGNVWVIGVSASSAADWDYTVAKFDTAGVYISDIRNALPGSGFDRVSAYVKDESGNLYVTGKTSSDGINYDIRTVKFNSSFLIEWDDVIDFSGQEDTGVDLEVDASGNVYIGGFVTDNNSNRLQYEAKYSASGVLQWQNTQPAIDPLTDSRIKALDIAPDGGIYVVSEQSIPNNSYNRISLVSKINEQGTICWQKQVTSNLDEQPMSINISPDGGIYVTSIRTNNTYRVTRFSDLKMDTNVILNANNEPAFKSNEIIVRFRHQAIDTGAINNFGLPNKKIEFAPLQYFLTNNAMTFVDTALSAICGSSKKEVNPCGIIAIKVFKELKTTMTTTINKLGETIPVPDFWTTLLLKLPDHMDLHDVYNAFLTIPNVVAYSEPNFIAAVASPPNDPLYHLQESLFTYNYDSVDINMEEAWEVYPEGGKSYIRCGVFDTGLDYTHPDFGYVSNNPNSGKVLGGWDFHLNVALRNSNTPDQSSGHGTKVSGIIGAIRNNNIGVAGIAGGNLTQGGGMLNAGVSLYGLKVINENLPGFFPQYSTLNYIYDAMYFSILPSDPFTQYSYNLDILSNSWGLIRTTPYWADTNVILLREIVRIVNKSGAIFAAASGNGGSQGNLTTIPAEIDDDWVITVGATGSDGKYKHAFNGGLGEDYESNRNWMVDLAAPGIKELVQTTKFGGTYDNFNGTSAATPHVAGIAGLILSYLNFPIVNYQNLTNEDVEHILELSATDTDLPGKDSLTGYGRLNAGAALRLIELPLNRVTHFGTNPNAASTAIKTVTALDSNVTVLLRETFQRESDQEWFVRGNYKVNVFRIDAQFTHTLPVGHNMIEYWSRPSGSTVLESLAGDSLLPRERVIINSCTNTSCNMSGYVYEVFDLSGNPLGWWPHSPNNLDNSRFEYTILSRDQSASVTEINDENLQIKLFPNPSNYQHTLSVTIPYNEVLKISMTDLQGRKVKTVYDGKTMDDEIILEISLSDLTPALYLYDIQIGDVHKLLRFIKQ